MNAKPDRQLLGEYAEQASEVAFGEIVSRHADLVYSAALRQMGSPDLAGDVTQLVFTDLARKARSLSRSWSKPESLEGWLYLATRYACLRLLRDERRRRHHERQLMPPPLELTPESSSDWDSLSLLLDEVMARLSDQDREAILHRYFKNQDLRQVGAALGISADAAQKRVTRALDKLRGSLVRRGVSTTAGALSTVLANNAVQVAPLGLVATLTNTSIACGTAGGGFAFTFGNLLSVTPFKVGVGGALIVSGLAITILQHHRAYARLLEEHQALRLENEQIDKIRQENQRLAKLKVDSEELDRLRQEHGELVRLRGEVGHLRRELAVKAQLSSSLASNLVAQTHANTAQAQITIEAKLITVPSNSSMSRVGVTGVLNDAQVRLILNALEQEGKAAMISLPRVTTLNGRQARICQDDASLERVQEKRTVPIVEVVATLAADDITINISTLTHFEEVKSPADVETATTIMQPSEKWTSANLLDSQSLLHAQMIEAATSPNRGDTLIVLITATAIDPAGNRVHTEEEVANYERQTVVSGTSVWPSP